jgi:acetyl esterase/lipase/predicted NBD/HSP70 family sugar kinase
VSRAVVALDLGGTHISAGRVDLAHARVDQSMRIPLLPSADRDVLLEWIIGAARDVAGDVDAVGFAVPGPFDYDNGVAWLGHKLEALYGVDLRSPLARALRLPVHAVHFVNDADAFALGEWWAGAAKRSPRVVAATLGTGLGSAFLADGKVVHAGPGVPPAGEIHRLSYRGAPVEEAVSRAALIESYGVPEVDVAEIAVRARNGDERAAAAFHSVARALGEVFAPWLRAFDATCFVVGGSIAAAWDLLQPGVGSALEGLDRLETIARASLLDDAPLLGAAYHAGERRRDRTRGQVEVMRRARIAAGTRPLHEMTVAEARAAQAMEPVRRRDSYELDTRDLQGPVPIRLHRPPSIEPVPLCVWLAGGGWVLDTTAAAEPACRRIAAETPCAVAIVRYRLAPEHRFPVPVDDCFAATCWLLESAAALGLDPGRVAIGGTSAGGNLAAAVTLRAREREDVDFAAQLLVYPVLLYDPNGARQEDTGLTPFLDSRDLDWCWSHYLAQPSDGSHPLASPLLAGDLGGLPPALVVTAEHDPLRAEGERYADRLRRAGTSVELVRFDDVPHGFFSLAGELDAADRAQATVIDALQGAFGQEGLPRNGFRSA